MMSIALDSSSSSMERSGFIRTIPPCISIFESPESGRKMAGAMVPEDRRLPAVDRRREEEEESASCSSSSIGRNSDCCSRGRSDGEDDSEEVQSSYKGPLDTMDALEESLPIRRGISRFYCGKSKSFTSLADTSSASANDLGKPENSYTRKRKNLLAYGNIWERNRNSPLRNSSCGISKRPTNSSRSTLALAVAMSSSESNTSEDHEPWLPLPPGPHVRSSLSTPAPQWSISARSFSLTDLQSASSTSLISPRDKQKKFQ
ncbi:protein OXIDATIVE STRESS 3 LIKE 1-like [Magnolia sinica]|uniref:protein OXIDATIVE STRESS 3 LIKE 1-like n=1 Tax=Magnolia sinica TaxID=86752 RepID=UPI002657EF5A|nr:protein OXIDATIVE STRESS 3 LIKE 1-like [Magnolia sinica]